MVIVIRLVITFVIGSYLMAIRIVVQVKIPVFSIQIMVTMVIMFVQILIIAIVAIVAIVAIIKRVLFIKFGSMIMAGIKILILRTKMFIIRQIRQAIIGTPY